MMQNKFDFWATDLFDAMATGLTEIGNRLEPKRWPTWLRRLYLLTLPISLPVHGVCWVLFTVGVALILVGALVAFLVSRAVHFWMGDRING